MSKLQSSNSSIDSGTFDGFDDPDDHFYDEPLLSSFDYHYLDNEKHRITINKPKIRPPKPPRHINPLTDKKLIDQSVSADLLLTLPPKGVSSLSTSSSAPPSSPLPLPSINTSKKPTRPPPPIPDHPPKPLRKKSEIKTLKDIEKESPMAVLNRPRTSQGSFYETAFDSKAIVHDNLRRGKISQHNRESIEATYQSNHHLHRSTECRSSDASFITDNINSSRSSTASPTSSSTGHESSRSSTPKHLDQLAASLLPRRQPIKSPVHMPRSKSSDVTLSLSATASNSSPINKFYMITMPSEAKTTTAIPVNLESGKHSQQNKMNNLSTFSMIKSTTCDTLSTSDFEFGRVLTRTRSNLDSLRLSIQKRNINRVNLPLQTRANKESDKISDLINSSADKDKMHHGKHESVTSKVAGKLSANRSFRSLNLKLNETCLPNNLSSPKLQSPLMDTRPLDDYDTPWDSHQRFKKVFNKLTTNSPASEKDEPDCFLAVNSSKAKIPLTESDENNSTPSSKEIQSTKGDVNGDEESIVKNANDAVFSTRVNKIDEQSTSRFDLNQHQSIEELTLSNNSNFPIQGNSESSNYLLTNKSIAMDNICKPERPRQLSLPLSKSILVSQSRKKPLLTFTHQSLPVVSEDIDTSLILEKQGWYHGSITRIDAENLLRQMKEGSYLIRNCESSKQDYSLSLKSVKGFMHMKIVKQSDGFVLGVFSKPFANIPEMVKHYSVNKLPIRGAEHMSLLYPVIDQLL